ncbi:hypothetical protein F5888DRAFT_1892693 [Russula emetica]|nr:hypothetical protein F5888DRAFT_1892693 [Russula emetica]
MDSVSLLWCCKRSHDGVLVVLVAEVEQVGTMITARLDLKSAVAPHSPTTDTLSLFNYSWMSTLRYNSRRGNKSQFSGTEKTPLDFSSEFCCTVQAGGWKRGVKRRKGSVGARNNGLFTLRTYAGRQGTSGTVAFDNTVFEMPGMPATGTEPSLLLFSRGWSSGCTGLRRNHFIQRESGGLTARIIDSDSTECSSPNPNGLACTPPPGPFWVPVPSPTLQWNETTLDPDGGVWGGWLRIGAEAGTRTTVPAKNEFNPGGP